MPAAVVDQVVRLIDRSEYKRRQAAPGIKITSKAFGVGRRDPIAADYRGLHPGCGGDPECPACWAHDILRALDGDAKRCTSDITLRDEEHCLCRCTLTGGHAGVHDDGAGTTWTGGDA